MYGVALAALGMLSTLCIALTIDAYGPISDNAGGIAEMCGLEETRERTDALDAAGNTTAAIGKGFAIGSAALVALALFGAFVTRTKLTTVNILSPLMFSGLVIGAMLPYAFTAMTMKSVGLAAKSMIQEISRQFATMRIREGEDKPNYERCIDISTRASLREMIAPGPYSSCSGGIKNYCEPGYYCVSGNTPVACSAGTYQPYHRQSLSTECLTCPVGHYCPTTAMHTPTPCPAGTYNANTGSSVDTACVSCDAGSVCPKPMNRYNDKRFFCEPGHYCPAGT